MPVTLNPADKHADITLSNGNLTATSDTAAAKGVRATVGVASGKVYFEVVIDAKGGASALFHFGILDAAGSLSTDIGNNSGGYAYRAFDGKSENSGGLNTFGATFTIGDIIGFAVDMDNGKIFASKNNSWQNSGDPVAGTGFMFSGLSGTFYPALSFYYLGDVASAVFASGDWTYSSPSGYSEIIPDDERTVADSFGVSDSVNVIGEYQHGISDGFGIADETDADEGWGVTEDEFGVADDIDGWLDTGHIIDAFGVADESDSIGEYPVVIGDEFGIEDEVDAGLYSGYVEDAFGIADNMQAGYELQGPLVDAFGIADESDAFNWTRWLAVNGYRAIKQYYFTLTGVNDDTTDIEIPISSFQARKRTGEQTFLSVIVPGLTVWASEIAARPAGEMVLEMALVLDGEISIREIIVRADLDTVTEYSGPNSRSLNLSGHKSEDFVSKNVALTKPTFYQTVNGIKTYRFSSPDPYLNPGDICSVDGGSDFTVDYITLILSESSKMMEVHET